MIEQSLVDARAPRDFVDARAVQPLEGKFGNGGLEDFLFREGGGPSQPFARWLPVRSSHHPVILQ